MENPTQTRTTGSAGSATTTTATATTTPTNAARLQSKLNPQSAAFSFFQQDEVVASSSSNPYPFDQSRPHPSALNGTTYKQPTRPYPGQVSGNNGGGGMGQGMNGYQPNPYAMDPHQQQQRFMPPPPDHQQQNWGGPANVGRVEGGWFQPNGRYYLASMPPPPPPLSRSMPPNPHPGGGLFLNGPPGVPTPNPNLLPAFQPIRPSHIPPPFLGSIALSPSVLAAPSPSSPPFASPRVHRPRLPPPSEAPALSFGPNARPPPGIAGFVPAPVVWRTSAATATVRVVPSPLSQTTQPPTPTLPCILESVQIPPSISEPPHSPPHSTSSSTVTANSATTPPQTTISSSLKATVPTTPNSSSAPSFPPTSLSSTTPSSHSSPILTPRSPTTTATTLSSSEEVVSSSVKLADVVIPSVPSTPAPKIIATQPSTPVTGTAPKKSWADLLKSPAQATPSSSTSPASNAPLSPAGAKGHVAGQPKTLQEILEGVESVQTVPDIVPRGLINNGNLCFANAILQVLVYCPPFWNLVERIGRETTADLSGSRSPSMDAMYVPAFSSPFPPTNFPFFIPIQDPIS